MTHKNEKERCKACYPCPMGVVGCDDNREPHGHGGTQKCPECGVSYAYVHPHSNACSKGTPISRDVEHDEYYLNRQLGYTKTGLNIEIIEAGKETGKREIDDNDTGEKETVEKESAERIESSHKFLALRLIPREQVIVGKNHVQSKLRVTDPDKVAELKRFAQVTIDNRIEFCKKYKTTEEEIGKCVCESLTRYIRLSKGARTKTITRDQVVAIKKMFEEMKKEGKIKYQGTLGV